jgi:hypothetical protein
MHRLGLNHVIGFTKAQDASFSTWPKAQPALSYRCCDGKGRNEDSFWREEGGTDKQRIEEDGRDAGDEDGGKGICPANAGAKK